MQWRSYFWPWHSISDLKVELLNGEKKLRSMRWKNFFLAMALRCQPESRTSQWRTT
jgi:hypothetical protein